MWQRKVSDKFFFLLLISTALVSGFSLRLLLLAEGGRARASRDVLGTSSEGGDGEGQLSPIINPTQGTAPSPTPRSFSPTATSAPQQTQTPIPTSSPIPTPDLPNLVIINPSLTPIPPDAPIEVPTKDGSGTVNISDPNVVVQVETKQGELVVSATDPIVPAPIGIVTPVETTPKTGATETSSLLTRLFGSDKEAVTSVNPTDTSAESSSFLSRLFGSTKQTSKQGFITILPHFPFAMNIELEASSLFSVNHWLDPYEVKLASGTDSYTYITRLGVTTATELPVRLALSRRSLSLLTPVGETKLVYPPDLIVEHLSDLDIIQTVGAKAQGSILPVAQATEPAYPIYLGWKNDRLTYRVQGSRNEFLLAFLPVPIRVVAEVDARTREIISISYDSRIQKILDVISI